MGWHARRPGSRACVPGPGWLIVIALLASACTGREQGTVPDPDGTSYGLSVPLGDDVATPYDEVSRRWGSPAVVRTFSDGLPTPWAVLDEQYGDTPLVASFKPDPREVVAGRHDAALLAWFGQAPTDRVTWWVYFHEPENDVEAGAYTEAEFRAAWEHVAALADSVENDALVATVVLMCWTLDERSGRDLDDYARASMGIEVLAWDCYNKAAGAGEYAEPADMLGDARQASESVGAGWGVGELGSLLAGDDDGRGRADWLTAVGRYASRHDAAFVTYFMSERGGDFVLDDAASADAWSTLMRTG